MGEDAGVPTGLQTQIFLAEARRVHSLEGVACMVAPEMSQHTQEQGSVESLGSWEGLLLL